MKIMKRVKILPVLVIVAFFSLSIRVSDIANDAGSYFEIVNAKQDDESSPPSFPEDNKKSNIHDNEVDLPPEGKEKIDDQWPDSSYMDISTSNVKIELFQDLSSRRKRLDNKETEMIKREALLQVAGKELDLKYQELKSIRNEIKLLLDQQETEEKGRIKSLVKIYEGMKAKDAAGIFNTLDIDILVQIMSKMSERKLSPIIASMTPERARSITILLAEQRSLPTMPE